MFPHALSFVLLYRSVCAPYLYLSKLSNKCFKRHEIVQNQCREGLKACFHPFTTIASYVHPNGRQAMQRTRVSGDGLQSSPQGEAVVLPSQRQRRLIQSAAISPRKGDECWQRLALLGVCRQGEARVGPAGG
jgi:hypothetical protein